MNAVEPKRGKIAHVIHLDGPGGGPRSVASHVSFYCTVFDVTVFHGGKGGALFEACKALGVRTVMLPLDKISTCFLGGFLLWWELRKLRPDLLILHGQWAGPIGAVAGRLAGVKKIVYICHWPAFYTDWDAPRIARNYFAEKIPCHFADRIITVSESNYYQYLVKGYVEDESRLLSIPNPVALELTPTAKSAAEVRNKFNWNEEHCHVVSVGRLTDQKKMEWLLIAWVRVQEARPEARLWIVGSGVEEQNLQKMAQKLGLAKSCFFLGDQRKGWDFVAAADLVVMTSLYEARGNVVTEAMASGRAVVANDVDGICDSMTDGVEGFLVPPADPLSLAEKLICLIENPALREKMGEAGKQSVQRFSKPKILKRYLTVLLNLLDDDKVKS